MKKTVVCVLLAGLCAPAAALTPEELFEKLSPSVYVIHTWDQQGRRLALGSGVVIGREQVITNCHVLREASAIAISRGNVSYGAELEFPDAERDLCQLSVKELAAPPVPLGELGSIKVGQRVYAIGAPKGLELTLTEGLISSLRGGDDERLIQTSAPISPGSSGGGLFDANGRLIGITKGALRGGQQLNFAVPVDWVREVGPRGKEALARRKQLEEARAAAAKSGGNATAVAALAPIDPSLPKEMPQPGDTWTYAVLDMLYKPGDRSRKFVHTVRSSARGAIVEVVTRDGTQVSQEAFSPDLSAVYRVGSEVLEVAPFVTAFRMPQAGERWGGIRIRGMEAIRAAAADEVPYHFEGGRVVGMEKVSVPAGTFDAIRVDLNGRVSNVLVGSNQAMRGYTTFRQTVWYAPQVKRVVKSVARGPNSSLAYELESFSLR